MPTHGDTVGRFDATVEHYVKYRPSYPVDVIALLHSACHLQPAAVVADIGMGTGIFTKLLLEQGYRVLGVEPNIRMKEKADRDLKQYADFTSITGHAETTHLATGSVDCVTAAMAFHWFNQIAAKQEFMRILKPGGYCFFVWNLRANEASPFMQAYENLLEQYGIDYQAVAAEKLTQQEITQFFLPTVAQITTFPNQQLFNEQGLLGRLLSTSYVPKLGHPDYHAMLDAATQLFTQHQVDGQVEFIYHTRCYYGPLSPVHKML